MGNYLRGQTAIMEVFLAILLMVPTMLLVSYTGYTISNLPQRRLAEYANAFYDFVGLAYYNTTVKECLLNTHENCAAYFNDIFSKYGGIHAYVVTGNTTPPKDNGSCQGSYYRCLPIFNNKSYTLVCLYLCGG
jgi:hypothetical protein